MKILKLKVGEVFIPENKKAYPVFQSFFAKKAKDGSNYYMATEPIFIQEVEDRPKVDVKTEKVVDA